MQRKSEILIDPGPGFYDPNYEFLLRKSIAIKFPERKEKTSDLDTLSKKKM